MKKQRTIHIFFGWCFTLSLMLSSFAVKAQNTTPFFQNFTKSEYKGDNQNWSITQGPSHNIYIANNRNLLEYNGDFWKKTQLPSEAIIRTVNCINDTLYSGAYHEFGYWTQDKKNQLRYHSLSQSLEADFDNDEFWKIIPLGDQIIFQSFESFAILDKQSGEINHLKFPHLNAVFAYKFKGELYLTTNGSGIFKLLGGELEFQEWSRPLGEYDIQAMIPFKTGALIATRLNGIYFYENNRLTQWLPPDAPALKNIEINNLKVIGEMLYLGTINNGLLIFKNKEIKYTLTENSGLVNNSVLSQFVDQNGSLWLGLDNGLACVFPSAPIQIFTDRTGKLGSVYSLTKAQSNNALYLGTNHGIFKTTSDSLSFIKSSNGQVWNLTPVMPDHQIIVGHNNGTYRLNNGKYQRIGKSSGGKEFLKIPESESYIQPNYEGLSLYTYDDKNRLWSSHLIDGLDTPINEVKFDVNGDLWLHSAHEGILKGRFERDSSIAIVENFRKGKYTGLFKINGDIFLKGSHQIYKYDALNDTLIRAKQLQEKLGKTGDVEVVSNKYIINNYQGNIYFYGIKNDYNLSLKSKLIEKKLIQDPDFLTDMRQEVYLHLVDGYAKINIDSIDYNDNNQHPELASLSINGTPQLIGLEAPIPYGKNTFEFKYTYNNPSQIFRNSFWYRLKGYDQAGGWHKTKTGLIVFENLPYGEYELLVSNGPFKKSSDGFKFEIEAPWYLNKYSIGCYILLAGLLIYAINFVLKRRFERQRRRFEKEREYQARLDFQREKMENQKHLAELKNSRLKDKIKAKSKELAIYAATMAKKEEILQKIGQEIENSKIKTQNKSLYARLMKIKERGRDSEKDWELFRKNFNDVHEEFFQKLQKNYPKLTSGDLKLCAYLKMNLTSKEIAPLIGITYRSVELHRYRLRKKLGLNKNQGLVKFLLSLTDT